MPHRQPVSDFRIFEKDTFLTSDPPGDQIFLATFRVTEGDSFATELADPSTEAFRIRSREYRDRLNVVFRRSWLKLSFLAAEILALDGSEGGDLVVHFDVRFDPRYQTITTADVVDILSREINPETSKYLTNLTIDQQSLEVQESIKALNAQVSSQPTVSTPPPTTSAAPPPRRCSPMDLSYCKHLPYNVTSYPNVLGHGSLADVEEDVIAFRELVDAECYRLAYDFVCQVLQPACVSNQPQDLLQLPCRSFCREFWSGCGSRLPDRIKRLLDCSNFPEYADQGGCRAKPGCVQALQEKALSPRICDGVIDCPDLSDEKNCAYCRDGYMHCGVGRTCIPHTKRCDGKLDCANGSDEKDCRKYCPPRAKARLDFPVSAYPNDSTASSVPGADDPSHQVSAPGHPARRQVQQRGFRGVQRERYHRQTLHREPERDAAWDGNGDRSPNCGQLAVQLVDVHGRRIRGDQSRRRRGRPIRAHGGSISHGDHVCQSSLSEQGSHVRPVLRTWYGNAELQEFLIDWNLSRTAGSFTRCFCLECGVQSLRTKSGTRGLNKMAEPGDWPWHVALFKEEVHVCDATLVAENWLITTASCFQGQSKAEWSARMGTVRLSSTSPWQQERRIVGMIKSPVEGSTTVLLKLDRPLTAFSDFVRPVCLPSNQDPPANASICNTLGWARNRDLLQRVQLRHSAMERCENISIASVNSVCTEPAYSTDDCNEEEVAGSPMLCLRSDGQRWALTGVGSWRIACSKAGIERPRLYDKVSSNIAWIRSTIE
ncbi:atrial natriuretic peptide-converting enzyme isoform X3 [Nomia melanderi]|uniref:atrial natriuretic peptide-converting enzyme isoform X3 n=1 Tax=Nomia melanderi TaxID=2448451 RepID=UPI0013045835|nr:atrial natriuretic peptide-converting enzyme isoform X3 [Nomia melanderi]